MSNSKTNQGGDSSKKRSLPSWMSSGGEQQTSSGKGAGTKEPKEIPHGRKSAGSNSTSNSTKLLEGVVFALSGFVNPERATLRSQALEMGAEYRPDWTSDCTLLVCAYSSTPKFRQVEADCGTIVKKEWILECYSQKKLVEIDSYLMHAGKPWRKGNISNESSSDQKPSPPRKSEKKVETGSYSAGSSSSKSGVSNLAKDPFDPAKVKKWAIHDLNRTISWLESQEEKPEPSEIKQIAAEGIVICLQDAIDFLEQNQDIRKITEQWNVVPRAIEELLKLADARNDSASLSNEDLSRHAKACKQIYEGELNRLDDDSKTKSKKPTSDEVEGRGKGRTKAVSDDAAGYDSDKTIEMTEEEIDLAYNNVASKFANQ
ncbi:hypothetical protein Tsubulata_025730 [Turnera subulata]|uniref:BRCT domain-containing protein n=1 Tax=Turnera subulata TaxID=218843 RepID=A0A9Q0FPW5_9ROSI|nr:hypothetical protein Tsubulata_025730 [Turnera subulata]